MNEKFVLALDLGSDTLKVAYGFKNKGKIEFGKIANDNDYITNNFKASAYYDELLEKWYYADEIENNYVEAFYNVVKIKNLLSLLAKKKEETIEDRNEYYFYHQKHFPKLYFPQRLSLLSDFEIMVEKGMTFTSKLTPYEVCYGYFDYVSKNIKDNIYKIMQKYKISMKVEIALIYPTGYGLSYVNKLKDIVETAFGYKVEMMINSTRAISYSAIFTEKLKIDDIALIFDIGEEKTSVLKVRIKNNNEINIDSNEGHLAPMSIGGYTIDEDLLKAINMMIGNIPIFGSDSSDFFEDPLQSQQYKLINDIKLAKMMVSSKKYDSLPIDVSRELTYTVDLSSILISSVVKNNFLGLISDYINKELNLTNNDDVNKIILTGGPIETYELFSNIKYGIKTPKEIKIEKVGFSLSKYNSITTNNWLDYEYSIYSASLGGIFAMINGYSTKTILSLTYGTYMINRKNNKKLFSVIANKGDALSEANKVFSEKFYVGSSKNYSYKIFEEYYSVNISKEEIDAKKFSDKLKYEMFGIRSTLLIDEYDGSRAAAKKFAGFKVVSGGRNNGNKDAVIIFKDKLDNRICIKGKIMASCILNYDFFGNVKPSIINMEPRRKEIEYIIYKKEYEKKYPNGDIPDEYVYLKDVKKIYSTDIKIEYLNLDEFNFSYEE